MFNDSLLSKFWWLPALGSFLAGLALAWHHPLWPLATYLAFCLWCMVAAWQPSAWLLVVPACLPWLNFSPWSGWLIFEEFDILLLGTLAGAYARLAFPHRSGRGAHASRVPWLPAVLMLLLGASGMLSLYRGVVDAGGLKFDWFAGYTDALNSVRVFKSLGFSLLFVPLLTTNNILPNPRAERLLASGMVLGLAAVTSAVLWERVAFPGLLDFSMHYRTVALFWEMHVGGGAIDAYLAMSTPFVVWALVYARRPMAWAGAAILALLTGYACLTTFSRGVYAAIVVSLTLLGLLLWVQNHFYRLSAPESSLWPTEQPNQWRFKASVLLILALSAEVAVVLGTGSFMMSRLQGTDRDLSSRMAHWRRGLALPNSPTDWLMGIGLGRLPARYASHSPKEEFSGNIKLGEGFVTLRGPDSQQALSGLYALTQRVSATSTGQHWIHLQVRVTKPTKVYVDLCERHLLYEKNCQSVVLHALPGALEWQNLKLALHGPPLNRGPAYAPHTLLLSLTIANVMGVADFDNIDLVNEKGLTALENSDFSQGLAHWFPTAQSYFLPWHTDNLLLEILLERGGLGLLLWLLLMSYALWYAVLGPARRRSLSPYLVASLCAAIVVGLVSSVMDVPRVAFLLCLLTLLCTPTETQRA